jgi:hypothetical protein
MTHFNKYTSAQSHALTVTNMGVTLINKNTEDTAEQDEMGMKYPYFCRTSYSTPSNKASAFYAVSLTSISLADKTNNK